MRDTVRCALAIAAKDLQVELQSRTALATALVFVVLVLVIFNFARDPAEVTLGILAPSALWVTAAFAAVVTLNRSFAMEREQGAIEGLLLAPVSRSAIFGGKLVANLVFVLVVKALLFPLFILFFNVAPSGALGWVALLLVLAATGFVAIGTVLAAMTVRTRFAELMLPVLMLPFLVPPVLIGVQGTSRLLAGRPPGEIANLFLFLAVYAVVFITLGWLVFPATMDE